MLKYLSINSGLHLVTPMAVTGQMLFGFLGSSLVSYFWSAIRQWNIIYNTEIHPLDCDRPCTESPSHSLDFAEKCST